MCKLTQQFEKNETSGLAFICQGVLLWTGYYSQSSTRRVGYLPLKSTKDWPTPQAFNEAIQNPIICFADAELKAGTIETNSIGLPKVASGAFASVYKVVSPSKAWAVRCFLTLREEQRERYQHISKYILVDDLECTIDFEYLDEGIKLGSDWYPILKMPWVEGPTLDNYIHQNISNRQKLNQLCKDFHTVSMQLEEAGIAHGDLQHGNIIVSPKGLRLVDYDAFFVPSLAGRKNMEFGHPSYQHPLRDDSHFDVSVDNFSSWLIYISILTLSIDPDLFKYVAGGDDCLLFRRSDLSEPESSIVFANMLAHDSDEVRKHAKLLMRMLWTQPHLVPPLNALAEDLEKLSSVKPPTLSPNSDLPEDSHLDIDMFVDLLTQSDTSADSESQKVSGKRGRKRNEHLSTKARRLVTEIVDLSLKRAAKPLWLCVTRLEAEKMFKSGNYEQAYIYYNKLHPAAGKRTDERDILLLLRLAHCCLKLDNQNQMENFCKAAANLEKVKDNKFNQLLADVLFSIARKQNERERNVIESMIKLLDHAFDAINTPLQFSHLTNVVAITTDIVTAYRTETHGTLLNSYARTLLCHMIMANFRYEQVHEEKYVDYLVQLRRLVDTLITKLDNDENLVNLATVVSQISVEALTSRLHPKELRELLKLNDSVLGNEIVFLGTKFGFLNIITKLANVTRISQDNQEYDDDSIAWLWSLWLNFEPFNNNIKLQWLLRFNKATREQCLDEKSRKEIIQQIKTKVVENWDLYVVEQVVKAAQDLGKAGAPLKEDCVKFIIEMFKGHGARFQRGQLIFARSLVRIYGDEKDVFRLEDTTNSYWK